MLSSARCCCCFFKKTKKQLEKQQDGTPSTPSENVEATIIEEKVREDSNSIYHLSKVALEDPGPPVSCELTIDVNPTFRRKNSFTPVVDVHTIKVSPKFRRKASFTPVAGVHNIKVESKFPNKESVTPDVVQAEEPKLLEPEQKINIQIRKDSNSLIVVRNSNSLSHSSKGARREPATPSASRELYPPPPSPFPSTSFGAFPLPPSPTPSASCEPLPLTPSPLLPSPTEDNSSRLSR